MNKYFKAVSTNFVFFVINSLLFLVITPLSIRTMGVDFYGLWSILLAIALFSNIGTIGIGAIVNKYSAEFESNGREYHHKVLTSGFIIIAPMAIIASSLVLLLRKFISGNLQTTSSLQSDFYNALLWIAFSLIPQFLAKVPQGYFLSQYENKLARSMDFLSNMLPWIGAICISVIDKNLEKVAEWFFLVQLIGFLIYLIILLRRVGYRLNFDNKLSRKMVNFSGFMFIESMAISFFQQFDRIIVGFVLGPVMAGVYSVGTSIGLRLSLITGQVTEVMIPFASLKDSLNEHERLFVVFRKLSQYVSLIMAGIGSILVLWMDDLLSLWISPSYAHNYSNPFCLLVIAYGLLSLSRPAHQTLTGLGKVKFTSLVYLVSSVAMLGVVYKLSILFGLEGSAFANMIMGTLLVYNLFIYHILVQKIPWRAVITDLQWGFFLPVIMYSLLLFNQTMFFRSLLTIILGLLLIIVLLKDDWAHAWLSQLVKRIVHN
jgi:O-antigen/teichoic acid export membrane protein